MAAASTNRERDTVDIDDRLAGYDLLGGPAANTASTAATTAAITAATAARAAAAATAGTAAAAAHAEVDFWPTTPARPAGAERTTA